MQESEERQKKIKNGMTTTAVSNKENLQVFKRSTTKLRLKQKKRQDSHDRFQKKYHTNPVFHEYYLTRFQKKYKNDKSFQAKAREKSKYMTLPECCP